MKNRIPDYLELYKIDEMKTREIEYIYMQVWHERGTIGGPKVWFDVIMQFLDSEGYEVVKKEKEDA